MFWQRAGKVTLNETRIVSWNHSFLFFFFFVFLWRVDEHKSVGGGIFIRRGKIPAWNHHIIRDCIYIYFFKLLFLLYCVYRFKRIFYKVLFFFFEYRNNAFRRHNDRRCVEFSFCNSFVWPKIVPAIVNRDDYEIDGPLRGRWSVGRRFWRKR